MTLSNEEMGKVSTLNNFTETALKIAPVGGRNLGRGTDLAGNQNLWSPTTLDPKIKRVQFTQHAISFVQILKIYTTLSDAKINCTSLMTYFLR